MAELKDRLAEALEKSGKTKMELARFCGVSHPSVSNWFNGRTKELTSGNAIKAATFLGVSAQWLTTGIGSAEPSVRAVFQEDNTPEGFISIPEYTVTCGAGAAFAPTYEQATESKPAFYREDWFRSHHIKPENCKRLKVHGDSMVPILFDGDTILVDCSAQKIIAGKIYAFCFGDEVLVKRLFPQLNGGVLVKSENPSVPDETIAPGDMSLFYLVGRVIDRSGGGPF